MTIDSTKRGVALEAVQQLYTLSCHRANVPIALGVFGYLCGQLSTAANTIALEEIASIALEIGTYERKGLRVPIEMGRDRVDVCMRTMIDGLDKRIVTLFKRL